MTSTISVANLDVPTLASGLLDQPALFEQYIAPTLSDEAVTAVRAAAEAMVGERLAAEQHALRVSRVAPTLAALRKGYGIPDSVSDDDVSELLDALETVQAYVETMATLRGREGGWQGYSTGQGGMKSAGIILTDGASLKMMLTPAAVVQHGREERASEQSDLEAFKAWRKAQAQSA